MKLLFFVFCCSVVKFSFILLQCQFVDARFWQSIPVFAKGCKNKKKIIPFDVVIILILSWLNLYLKTGFGCLHCLSGLDIELWC